MKRIETKVQLAKMAMRIERKLRERLDFNDCYKIDMLMGLQSAVVYVYSPSDDYVTGVCVQCIAGVIHPFSRVYGSKVFYGVTSYREKNLSAVRICIMMSE